MTGRVGSGLHHRRVALALIAGFVVAAAPSPAGAAVQIGETFTPDPSLSACAGNTFLQSGSPGGQYAAPFAGVITSWSYQAPASNLPQLKFKVARPAGGNDFTIVGEEGPHTPTASALNTYPARIAVEAGDVIGLYFVSGSDCARNASSSYTYHYLFADPAPQTTATFSAFSGIQFDVSATLERDCDSDGFGDDTQDPDTSSCNPQPQPQPEPEPTPETPAPVASAPCANAVVGDPKNNNLQGTAGSDSLKGLAGNDKIQAGAGDDCARGGPGKDNLDGGEGNDQLNGGQKPDVLDGGPGDDLMKAIAGQVDVVKCGPGNDTARAQKQDIVNDDCEHIEH